MTKRQIKNQCSNLVEVTTNLRDYNWDLFSDGKMSLSSLACAQVVKNTKGQYDQMLELADQGWDNEAQFHEYCEALCRFTLKVAGQLEGNNAVDLHVDDTPLPEEIKTPLTKVRDLAKGIRNLVPFIVNWEWFDFNQPRHLEVFRLAIREEIRKMRI